MRINFKEPRKWSLPINILLFNLCRLIPSRDKHLWVFGGREGNQFDDNARYLFEYVNNNHKNIKAIWLTKDEKTVEYVRSLGYESYTFYSKEGIKNATRAGISVYSHALLDFGLFPLVGGSTIVCLWHGVGFKKIYNSKYSGMSLFMKKALDRFFSWTRRDITTVTSKYTFDQFQYLFNLKPSTIIITGQPRNDVLFRDMRKSDVIRDTNIPENKRLILYMPTYRSVTMGADHMENIVRSLYDSKELIAVLDETNSVFVAKLHPLTPHIDIKNRDNFVILDYGAVKNNQELLTVSDMMVTDYSSCFVDFALLNRPIGFFTPDEKQFIEQSEGMDDVFFRISNMNKATSPEQLAQLIREASTIVCDATTEVFEDQSIKGSCYCENVYNAISKRIVL